MPTGVYKGTKPAWNKGRKTVHAFICQTCKQQFFSKRTKSKFCRRSCIRTDSQFKKGQKPLHPLPKGYIPWNKGKRELIKKICPTCKKEFSFALTGKGSKPRAQKFCSRACVKTDTRFKKGNTLKLGIKHSEETKKKLSGLVKKKIAEGKHNFVKGHQFGFRKGLIPWNKGKDFGSTEYLAKRISWLTLYRKWRISVKKKDGFKCTECGNKNNLNVDHYPISLAELIIKYKIKKPQEAKKHREFWNIKNGRTLCVSCHKQTQTYGKNFVQKMQRHWENME